MTLPQVAQEFRVVQDPELRFSADGMAVCYIRLVADQKKKVGDEWVDDKVVWLGGKVFGKMGEHAAELKKGQAVVVIGKLITESWAKDDGTKGQNYNVLIDSIGLSVRWAPAQSLTAERAAAQAEVVAGETATGWGQQPTHEQSAPY